MSLAQARTPSAKELRDFALLVGAVTAVVFGLLLPWLWGRAFPWWPWVVLVLLGGWGLLAPASLAPVHKAWMKFAEVVGRINNRIVLGLVFFVLFVPFGRMRRFFARDPMARAFDRDAKSYRIPRSDAAPSSMENPF
jgi:Saxitoxin biosynthesis operon protein SxtJ